jgi:hypothetical protein
MMTGGGWDSTDRTMPRESARSAGFRVAGAFEAPYSSDQPQAVLGPWRAVLVRRGRDLTVGFDQWMTGTAWAYQDGQHTVAVVRGTATPMDVDDNGVGTVPTVYDPDDVLFRYERIEGAQAVSRWAQARMVAALLNRNQEKLDQLDEREGQ